MNDTTTCTPSVGLQRIQQNLARQRVLAEFFDGVNRQAACEGRGRLDVLLFIGDANTQSSARGERSVPTQAVMTAMRAAFNGHSYRDAAGKAITPRVTIKVVNEYHTTKCCCGCHKEQTDVLVSRRPTKDDRRNRADRRAGKLTAPRTPPLRAAPREPGSRDPVLRGLKYCSHCKRVWDRDANAALNMAIVGLGEHLRDGKRPPAFVQRRDPHDGGGAGAGAAEVGAAGAGADSAV